MSKKRNLRGRAKKVAPSHKCFASCVSAAGLAGRKLRKNVHPHPKLPHPLWIARKHLPSLCPRNRITPHETHKIPQSLLDPAVQSSRHSSIETTIPIRHDGLLRLLVGLDELAIPTGESCGTGSSRFANTVAQPDRQLGGCGHYDPGRYFAVLPDKLVRRFPHDLPTSRVLYSSSTAFPLVRSHSLASWSWVFRSCTHAIAKFRRRRHRGRN